jgi:uncharacterized protein YndB with AHSA1/START domain
MSVEESIDIRAPAALVFLALTDPRRGREWNTSITEIRDVTGLPVQVGTTWTQVVTMMGRAMTLHCRVIEFDPPRGGVIEVSGDQRGRLWTRCQEHGGVTRVTQGMDFVPPGGALGRLGMGLARGMISRELNKTLTRQRAVLEQEFGPAPLSDPSG